jgi:mycofactocin precursor
MKSTEKEDSTCKCKSEEKPQVSEAQDILEEIEIEDLAVDGICGVY